MWRCLGGSFWQALAHPWTFECAHVFVRVYVGMLFVRGSRRGIQPSSAGLPENPPPATFAECNENPILRQMLFEGPDNPAMAASPGCARQILALPTGVRGKLQLTFSHVYAPIPPILTLAAAVGSNGSCSAGLDAA